MVGFYLGHRFDYFMSLSLEGGFGVVDGVLNLMEAIGGKGLRYDVKTNPCPIS